MSRQRVIASVLSVVTLCLSMGIGSRGSTAVRPTPIEVEARTAHDPSVEVVPLLVAGLVVSNAVGWFAAGYYYGRSQGGPRPDQPADLQQQLWDRAVDYAAPTLFDQPSSARP